MNAKHMRMIVQEYAKACEKHPKFCDGFTPLSKEGVESFERYNRLVNSTSPYFADCILMEEIEQALSEFHAGNASVPDELAYLEGPMMDDYIHDMCIAQQYAVMNREAMLRVVQDFMEIDESVILDKFCTVHNYIDQKNKILRKGAISLRKDEKAIIPMNMRDGSLIVLGKGNPDWNFSGPHGAGRIMSRSMAKEVLDVEEFKGAMQGIYTTCVGRNTIDESPMAYKPMEEIIENIRDTATIETVIKPIYNFKAEE